MSVSVVREFLTWYKVQYRARPRAMICWACAVAAGAVTLPPAVLHLWLRRHPGAGTRPDPRPADDPLEADLSLFALSVAVYALIALVLWALLRFHAWRHAGGGATHSVRPRVEPRR